MTGQDLHPQPWKNKHWILGAVLTAVLPEGFRNNVPGVSQQESRLAAVLGASSATDHVRDFLEEENRIFCSMRMRPVSKL